MEMEFNFFQAVGLFVATVVLVTAFPRCTAFTATILVLNHMGGAEMFGNFSSAPLWERLQRVVLQGFIYTVMTYLFAKDFVWITIACKEKSIVGIIRQFWARRIRVASVLKEMSGP